MGSLVVRNGRVVAPGGVVERDVVAIDGVLVALVDPRDAPDADVVVDAAGGWVSAGFIDAQLNGSDGIDLTSTPTRLAELAALLPAEGVTSFAPTIVTCPDDVRARALGVPLDAPPTAARPIGFHLEGPLLAPTRRGAHRAASLRTVADVDTAGWSRAAGVAVVTIAPEVPGALELIGHLVRRGVTVALGHTDATAEQFAAGVAAGATAVTHLFNAMRPFGHRDPGPVGVTLAHDHLVAGLIVDGIHVDPLAVAMVWRALGPQRTLLVTDAVAARGAAAGPLGGATATRDETGVRLADGTLAGSDLHLDAAVRNLVAFTGCAVPAALATVTSTPAGVLGLVDRGVLAPGRRADITVLDAGLRVTTTIVGGEVAWSTS